MAIQHLKVWNGTAWTQMGRTYVYSGTAWDDASGTSIKVWDGDSNEPGIGTSFTMSNTLLWTVSPPTPTAVWTNYTKTFKASWTATYEGGGSKRGDTNDLYQGYYSSTRGNQKSLAGFTISGLPATSGTAVILSAYITLQDLHWGNTAGGTAVIGTHTLSSAPATYSGTGVTQDRVRSAAWGRDVTRRVSLGTTIGAEIMNGTTKGIVLGAGPSTSTEYYGYFQGGIVSSSRPSLEVNYKVLA